MEASQNRQHFTVISWALGAIVSVLAFIAWYGVRVDGRSLSIYDWFPLFGLIAYSLMWTHYTLGALRRYMKLSKEVNHSYSVVSGVVVLVCILLHPTLLITGLQRDGFGLPPNSYFAVYTEPIMKGAIVLGTISLLIFLAYELKRWLEKKSLWRVVNKLQLIAMALIFYHALVLGGELSVGWFRLVWYLYGVSLISSVGYNYWYDKRNGGEDGTKATAK